MKIAMVTETFLPQTDGIVTRLTAAIDWLQQEGHDILVIAPGQEISEYNGAKIVGLPQHAFFLYRDKKLAFPTRKIRQYLQDFAPDIVHVVNPAMLGIAGIYYAAKDHWPLVASYHTHIPKYADYYHVPMFKPLLWWFLRSLHNKADLNLCTSNATQAELQKQQFKNVNVWHRGVDTKQFHPDFHDESMRDYLTDGKPSKTLLLYVGRLAAEKELEKLRYVLEKSDDFVLALVGDGPDRERLEKHFSGTQTVFTGFLHGDDLSKAYASSDIFTFPSTTETLGLVILEAMSSGLPVVAAKSGPTSEQIEDGTSGLLFDPESDESFIDAVMKLGNPYLQKSLAVRARKMSRTMGWDRPSRQLLGFYEEVLYEHVKSDAVL